MSTRGTTSTSAGSPATTGAGAFGGLAPALVAALAVLVFVIDQVSKNWALRELSGSPARAVIGDLLQLRLVFNPGAAFGMGAQITPVITGFQIAISIAIVLGTIFFVRNPWWGGALGLMLGGAMGNVYDRLMRPPGFMHGHVIDFLQLPNWPVFNVADIGVSVGALMLVILTFMNSPAGAREPGAHGGSQARGTSRGDEG